MAGSISIIPEERMTSALWDIVTVGTGHRQVLRCGRCKFWRIYGMTKRREAMTRRIRVHYIEDHPELLLDRSDPVSVERWLAS